jgi:predicted amidohydrolase
MRALLVSFWAGVLFLSACAREAPVHEGTEMVLRNVRIVDTESGVAAPPQDIAIADGVIIGIGQYRPSPEIEDHDLNGNYIIAGLWDLHVHLEAYTMEGATALAPEDWHIPLSMSYGVLGLRDLGSRTGDILALVNADLKFPRSADAKFLIM